MRISDWSSDVCSSDLQPVGETERLAVEQPVHHRQIGEGKLGKHNDDKREQHGGGAHGAAQRQRAHVQEADVEQIGDLGDRSEEHTSELQSLMRISYAVFCLKKKKKPQDNNRTHHITYKPKQKK